jgi:flagellar biosynthesis component FlhA
MSTTEQRLEWFGKKAIATIEELEQQTTALVNEAVDEIDFNMLQRDYEKLVADYVKAQGLLKIVETERNTLSQVLRILASGGEIDPVSETEQAQAEMKDENV